MSADTVFIELRDIDVAETLSLVEHWIHGMAKLWAAGRLRSLIETPEGMAAVEEHERNIRTLQQNLEPARASGLLRTSFRMKIPADPGKIRISMVETLYAMLCDEKTMHAVDAEPLTANEAALARQLMGISKTATAGGG